MGFLTGIFKRLFKLILYSSIIIAIILLIPNLPPYTKFTSIEIEPTQSRIGSLSPNGALNNAEYLYKDKLLGPEAFQVWNGEVYTGLATGEIVKVSPGGHVTFVTKIGQPCTGLVQEHICGRPLGFVIDEKNKNMFIADAYYGIWKVNLESDKKQLLVSPQVAIDGRVPKLFNSVALAANGDLYWTDSSSDFQLKDGVMALFSDPTGRLFHYSATKNESKVLLDNLWFANGLVVSPDNHFILVAETDTFRLIKYHLTGPKKGTSEVFVAGLPGTPDTVRPLPDGSGVLVSLYAVFDDEHPLLTKSMAATPLVRKFIARLIRLIEIPFEFLNSQFPHYIFEEVVYYIGSFGSVSNLSTGLSGLVQIDWNGNIIASYYNTDGSLLHISDAIVFNDKLYTGCPHKQNFIGAVPAPPLLKKAFSTKMSTPTIKETKTESQYDKQVPKEAEKVKPKVQEKREQIKVAAPAVEKAPPTKETKPIEKTPPPSKAPAKPDIKPKVVTKEPVIKQNAVPKEPEVKPKNTKPKDTPKLSETKPKVEPKETETKSKPVQEKAEVKTKIEQKPVLSNSKAAESSKVKSQESEKPKPKSDNKEKETSAKVVREFETKSKSSTATPTPSNAKANKASERKPESQGNAKSKPSGDSAKKVEPKPKATTDSTKASTKPIPVEEDIPSDTVKPNKDKLKVIKKSGPQEIPNPNL